MNVLKAKSNVFVYASAVAVFLAGLFVILRNQDSSSSSIQSEQIAVIPVAHVDTLTDTEGKPKAAATDDEKSAPLSAHGAIPFSPPTNLGKPSELPLPSKMSVPAFEELLFDFLNNRVYDKKLGWLQDKSLRDTGPFIKGKYYGTHPAVRIFYSPGVIKWLMNGRSGTIPDGEMIIKEQFAPPAIRHEGKSEEDLWASQKGWTIMIKDSAGSQDGWFWGDVEKGSCVVNNHAFPFNHPKTGFGHYCVRCHAATQSPNIESPRQNNEFTFIALRNIEGFPGEPLIFRVDDSWRPDPAEAAQLASDEGVEDEAGNEESLVALVEKEELHGHPKCTQQTPPDRPDLVCNQKFLDFYGDIQRQSVDDVLFFPPVTHDWVVKQNNNEQGLVTSNQCMSCHAGLVDPFGPSMFVEFEDGKTGYGDKGWHVSPYGEWRWTPMGLAGRDPVFFAQLESEIEILKKEFEPEQADLISKNLMDTCLRCHGAMGKHQFDLDKKNPHEKFSVDHVYTTATKDEHIGMGDSKYGALARDGISCVICHRSQPRPQPENDERPYLQHYLDTSITGNFFLGPADEVYGPFKDEEISSYVMEHAMAMKPKHNDYISSSRMCGTCHTVNLPAVDRPLDTLPEEEKELDLVKGETVPAFKKFKHHVEQATYLEWLNSEFENEFNKDNPKAKSCQDCHMSKGLKVDEHGIDIAQISTRIAAIQDSTYPDAENLTSHENLNIRIRNEGYRRHNFAGLNAFLLEIFNQFDDVLGVRKHDFMTGSKIDVQNAIENFKHIASRDTADVAVDSKIDGQTLLATVDIKNKAGHRFPSGVGFRRAFLEFKVIENEGTDEEKVIWISGQTNELGVLLGKDGKALPSETFAKDSSGIQQFQPHHQVIKSQDQVQIYETLLWNQKGEFTTSFVHGCDVVKDNRFLPRGWKHDGPDPTVLTGNFLHATHPGPAAAKDTRYQDGSGSDSIQYEIELPFGVKKENLTVKASLYYQAMPPYFLKAIFENSPNGDASKRLHYILSNINLKGTAVEDWKLPVTSASAKPN